MTDAQLTLLFAQLSLMLTSGLFLGKVAGRLGLPAVLGEIFGGILLGPTILGTLDRRLQSAIFPSSGAVASAREAVVQLSLLLFIYVVGLQVNPQQVRRRIVLTISTSTLAIAVPFAVAFGAVLLFPVLFGAPDPHHLITFALVIATILSISALPVIARILMDLRLLGTEIGTLVMSGAAIADLMGTLLFAAILGDSTRSTSRQPHSPAAVLLVLMFFAFLLVMARRCAGTSENLAQWHLKRIEHLGTTTAMVLAAGAMSAFVGVPSFVGALLVGVARAPYCGSRDRDTAAVGFLAPLYFVSMGLRTNFAAYFDFRLLCIIFVVASIGKMIGGSLGAWIGRMPVREALAVGVGLNARGAIGVVLASVALDHGLIQERMFVGLVGMALFTSLLSGPIMQRLLVDRQPPLRPEPPSAEGEALV